jgi:phosphoribosylglycinamide formyltransferase 1
MNNIALFASGSGTNAQTIIEYFKTKEKYPVKLILSNKPDAFVLKRANKYGISTRVFSKDEFYTTNNILNLLKEYNIDLIVLAGFLWLIPDNLLLNYKNRIINIHPALLPKYGGKGMYGMKVHEAVVRNKDVKTGITIHYVDEVYDNGEIIFQVECPVYPSDTPDEVALKVHQLEYEHFPRVIEKILLS